MKQVCNELNKSSVLFASGLIAECINSQGVKGTLEGYGGASVVLHDDHTCEIYYQYTITENNDTASGYQFGLSVDALRAINSNIPDITPIIGGLLLIIHTDGTIPTETSTTDTSTTKSGYGAFHQAYTNYPKIWLTSRVYKTGGSTGTWSSSSIAKFTRITGVALGTW